MNVKNGERRPPPDPTIELIAKSPVTSLTFGSGDTPAIISGHQNGQVIKWDNIILRPEKVLMAHNESVIWLTQIGEVIISQGRDGEVKFWSCLETEWRTAGVIPCAPYTFCNSSICLSNNQYFLSVPSDACAEIKVHKLTNLSDAHEFESLSSPHSFQPKDSKRFGMCMRTSSLVSSCLTPVLFVGYESGVLGLWNLKTAELLSEVKAHEDSIMGMDSWAHEKYIKCVTGSVENQIKSWWIKEFKFEEDKKVTFQNAGINALAIRRDGKIVATGGWDHMCRVFSLKKLNPLAVLSYHKDSVQCVCFALDHTLATGSKEGHIALWNIYK